MRLDISVAALRDLEDILRFSAGRWGRKQAFIYVGTLRARIREVARQKRPGNDASDIAPDLRRLVVGSHVIWFRLGDEALRVIRVLHQATDAGRRVEMTRDQARRPQRS